MSTILILPDNATNGDVIKHLYEKNSDGIIFDYVHNDPECITIAAKSSWMDAPYEQDLRADALLMENPVYLQGLEDSWDCIKKIVLPKEDGGLQPAVIDFLFGCMNSYSILKMYAAKEAVSKVKVYEKTVNSKDPITVGDEVALMGEDVRGVVLHIEEMCNDITLATFITATGETFNKSTSLLVKTGKHIDAAKDLMESLR